MLHVQHYHSNVILSWDENDFCECLVAGSKKAKLLQDLSEKLPDTFKYKLQVLSRDKTDKDKVYIAIHEGAGHQKLACVGVSWLCLLVIDVNRIISRPSSRT